METNQTEFLNNLKQLQQEFVNSLSVRIEKLKEHEQIFHQDWQNTEKLQQLFIDIHTLAGSGATFGFKNLSQTAKKLEHKITPLLKNKNILSLNQHKAIHPIFLELERQLKHIIDSYDKNNSDLIESEDVSVIENIEPMERTTDNKHILLVEDDEVLAKSLAEQIQTFGYSVTILHNAKALHSTLKKEIACALIIDIMLPEGNTAGIEAIKKIREKENSLLDKIPIIFISSRTDIEARLATIRAGGNAYLVKPLDVGHLIEWVDKLLSHHSEEAYYVLIIDDDKEVAQHHALILENAGILTRICNDPLQILTYMENRSPDLILMDLYMPNCNGCELTAVIRQIDPYVAIPIIYLSTEHSCEQKIQALLQGGDNFLIKPIFTKNLISIINYQARRFRKLRALMVKDGLTNLYNHRYIKEFIKNECARAQRDGTTISLAMFDVDYFKQVNDTYGHATGDFVLKTLSRFLEDRVRKTDLVGRYGGEEFVVIFPNTSLEIAAKLCEKLRIDFEKILHFSKKNNFQVTFSCGIASYPDYNDAQLLSDKADKALYISKTRGRNQVTVL
jgi:diguanylate cyclase (GGDEF)-like protein